MRSKIQHAILSIALVLLMLPITGTRYAWAQVAAGTVTQLGHPQTSKAGTALPSSLQALPSCPHAGSPQAKATQSAARHHKVFLAWNASAPAPKAEGNAAGYCLYRSHTEHAAKQNPPCRDCEQVNTVPITGTRCIDDLVNDGEVYYYVLLAVNSQGKPSDWSNEASANIPDTDRLGVAPAGPVPPACRPALHVK